MNNEIKEMLELHIKNDIDLLPKNQKIVLDYITNLQEQLHQASLDIQELTERDIECPSWCNKLTNLQQENNNLKTSLDESQEVVIDLQQRIEKAVEILKRYTDNESNYYVPVFELIDILNGRSDE